MKASGRPRPAARATAAVHAGSEGEATVNPGGRHPISSNTPDSEASGSFEPQALLHAAVIRAFRCSRSAGSRRFVGGTATISSGANARMKAAARGSEAKRTGHWPAGDHRATSCSQVSGSGTRTTLETTGRLLSQKATFAPRATGHGGGWFDAGRVCAARTPSAIRTIDVTARAILENFGIGLVHPEDVAGHDVRRYPLASVVKESTSASIHAWSRPSSAAMIAAARGAASIAAPASKRMQRVRRDRTSSRPSAIS